MMPSHASVAKLIDHSLLRPMLKWNELEAGCRLAVEYDVASVCILPFALKRCSELLAGSSVRPSTTIGFPHGGHTTEIKLAEVRRALADGGQELDMVVNVSQVLSGAWNYVAEEIRQITKLTQDAGQRVKVIFETCYLSDDEKLRLCEICNEIGVDWVKTSTGFGTQGATHHDVELMVKASAPGVQVKAAGGVRTLEALLGYQRLGATRVGCTNTKAILEELKRSE